MMERTDEIGWVLLHLDDLDADFARFFHVDYLDLDGPRFFTRAQRVSAYGGVMTMRLAEVGREAEPEPEEPDTFAPPVPAGAVVRPLSDFSSLIEG